MNEMYISHILLSDEARSSDQDETLRTKHSLPSTPWNSAVRAEPSPGVDLIRLARGCTV